MAGLNGKQWHPMPVAVTADLALIRWTRDNPAPKSVAYSVAWAALVAGAGLSIRQIAEYAGWSRWKAEQLRREVTDDFGAWANEPTHQTKPDSHRTATGQQPDTSPQQSPALTEPNRTATGQQPDSHQTTRARSSSIQVKDTGKGSPSAPSPSAATTATKIPGWWLELMAIHLEVGGTGKLSFASWRPKIDKATKATGTTKAQVIVAYRHFATGQVGSWPAWRQKKEQQSGKPFTATKLLEIALRHDFLPEMIADADAHGGAEPPPPKKWTIDSQEDEDALMADGLGTWFAEKASKYGNDYQKMHADFKADVGGSYADFPRLFKTVMERK